MSVPVVFFTDRAMLPGLHGAVASLASHAPHGADLRIIVFCDAVSARERRRIAATHDAHAHASTLQTREYRSGPYAKGANSLHGNYTAYGRLRLAELLPDEARCIYLDSDILVTCDVREILDHLPGDRTLAAYAKRSRAEQLDTPLYAAAGLDLAAPSFNSGVLGMNLARWRALDMDARCRDVAARHPDRFRSADQALLNVACDGEVAPLPRRLNFDVYCDVSPDTVPQDCVLHFVGSPKPWDPAGARLHACHALWLGWARRTCLPPLWRLRYASPRRTLATSLSALRWYRKRRGARREGPGSAGPGSAGPG